MVYLPKRLDPRELREIQKADENVSTFYKRIGRIMAKAIIDRCPIPVEWASDFLINYLLGEDPSKASIPKLLSMLIEIDPQGYSW